MTDQNNKVFRSGMVSIVGRPNTGKSTLLNQIIQEKIAIVSKVPQTTRQQIRGIHSDERGQIVFIDTPGLHKGRDALDRLMNQSSGGTIDEVDCIIYLVDTSRRIGEEEQRVADRLKSVKVPVIMGLNKVDLKTVDIPSYISFWEKVKGQSINEMDNFMMVALSGKDGINIDKLLEIVLGYLPEGPALYPTDVISDMPQKMAVADIVREKLFQIMDKELPHALGVVVEEMRPIKGKTILVKALIFVERPTQKEIVIGKNGHVLKKVGSLARSELEDILESKVFLELYVKTQKNWRDNIGLLQELGYDQMS